MLRDIDNKLNMNAAFELLRKCNTPAEVRVYCAAEGIDADSLAQACMRSVAIMYSIDPDLISKDFTVETLYKYRPNYKSQHKPQHYIDDDFKFGITITETDFSFYCIEYDMVKDALAGEFNIKRTSQQLIDSFDPYLSNMDKVSNHDDKSIV